MMKLHIAFLQITPGKNLSENLEKGLIACKKAKDMGADIALFPEMWSNGYDIYNTPPEIWKKDAVSADSDFVNAFAALAKDLSLAIGITFLEKREEGVCNSMVLFDRFGERKFTYAKVHTCDFSVERALLPGEDFFVCDLDTEKGIVKVGAMICYDREFPESARILMLKGAELVLVPNACPMEINRLSQLRGRAYENMMAFATCNFPAAVPDCNGASSLFDGVAYVDFLPTSRDTCLFLADEKEGVFLAELDLDLLRSYRENEVHGNAYRRPDQYHLLIEDKISEPFLRPDRRK